MAASNPPRKKSRQAKRSKPFAGKNTALASVVDAPIPDGETEPPAAVRPPARIVGIGASAGGLEALESFFHAMPVDSGLAFVIVQHLSPDFRSMMDELLARHSRMRIRHALDGMPIESNTVYLNPPRQNLIVEDGKLYLAQPNPQDHPNLPIDAFFASLAKDRHVEAIGIILSGTGSDGTKGAGAIIEAGGVVLAQEPASAKFENMPRSAIEKGVTTATAPPDQMPGLIARVISGEALPTEDAGPDVELEPEGDILRQLERRFGANFGYYKKTTVGRRLMRRAALMGLQNLANYAAVLRKDPAELERLYADLLIGVTAFFRDSAAFASLSNIGMPWIARTMSVDRQLRVWIPGCASGEEAYSIAILLSEYARLNNIVLNTKIFATDLHHGSLETAGAGLYSSKCLSELSDELRDRYFDAVGGRYQVKTALRRLIVFSPHNLIKDPPFTRLDLVSCRNLMIYFDEVAQAKVLSLFHFALNKDGVLFLGPSESLGILQEEFESLDGRWRIYRKLRDVPLPDSTRLLPPMPIHNSVDPSQASARGRAFNAAPRGVRNDRRFLLKAYDEVLERYAPPSLLISQSGDLVHVFGDARKFLRLRAGLFSHRYSDVLVDELRSTVASSVEGAWARRAPQIARQVTFRDEGGRDVSVLVRAEVLDKQNGAGNYALVTLIEQTTKAASGGQHRTLQVEAVEASTALHGRIDELERNLTYTEESLQTTIEELETSNEELQSTNEELMSANEELQSTNEELHAVNEELYSVSSEHRRKIEELTALNNDMDHLLRCTDVGTIFLDSKLCIRRFTPAIARAFNLLDRDIGRPIQHITARFAYPNLADDVAKVAATGETVEHTVDFEDMHLVLRVFPYRAHDRIEGIVLTLVDVPRLKAAERALELRNHELARVNESLEQFTYIVSHDLRAPLRTILNSAKWIEEDLASNVSEEVRGHCHRLMTYSSRLTDMLNDLMTYAKLGTSEAPVEKVDIKVLLNGIVDSIDGDGRVQLVMRCDTGPIWCRRAPLQLVFQNLIDNALKYSDQVKVSVRIELEVLPERYMFTVSDDGPGIITRHHEKIFLPFRKLEHADTKPGTGMGLALVKKAVEDNGGTIQVTSDPLSRRGTAFVFTWVKAMVP